jgi:hypothetical protein
MISQHEPVSSVEVRQDEFGEEKHWIHSIFNESLYYISHVFLFCLGEIRSGETPGRVSGGKEGQ